MPDYHANKVAVPLKQNVQPKIKNIFLPITLAHVLVPQVLVEESVNYFLCHALLTKDLTSYFN